MSYCVNIIWTFSECFLSVLCSVLVGFSGGTFREHMCMCVQACVLIYVFLCVCACVSVHTSSLCVHRVCVQVYMCMTMSGLFVATFVPPRLTLVICVFICLAGFEMKQRDVSHARKSL